MFEETYIKYITRFTWAIFDLRSFLKFHATLPKYHAIILKTEIASMVTIASLHILKRKSSNRSRIHFLDIFKRSRNYLNSMFESKKRQFESNKSNFSNSRRSFRRKRIRKISKFGSRNSRNRMLLWIHVWTAAKLGKGVRRNMFVFVE